MSEKLFRIAVLASGGGTNLQAIIDQIEEGRLKVEPAMVISDNLDAYALKRAEKHGICSRVVQPDSFGAVEDYEREMVSMLKDAGVDLVVLAGFMRILSPIFVNAFPLQIINIHPSLIPAFCGQSYYGMKVHQAAVDYGVKISGCTVIFVTEEPDGGPIILQRAVEVKDDDQPEDLAARVLKEEHKILPQAIKLIAAGAVSIKGRRVKIDQKLEE